MTEKTSTENSGLRPIQSLLIGVEYSPIPIGDYERSTWAVRVEYRSGEEGRELYGVFQGGRCLGADGSWDYEPTPSSRTDEWLVAHRFEYWDACSRAARACGDVRINGKTANEVAALSSVVSVVSGETQ